MGDLRRSLFEKGMDPCLGRLIAHSDAATRLSVKSAVSRSEGAMLGSARTNAILLRINPFPSSTTYCRSRTTPFLCNMGSICEHLFDHAGARHLAPSATGCEPPSLSSAGCPCILRHWAGVAPIWCLN